MIKLFFIDDEIKLRPTISKLFSLSVHKVIEAQDRLEVPKKSQSNRASVIICDLMMPKINDYGF